MVFYISPLAETCLVWNNGMTVTTIKEVVVDYVPNYLLPTGHLNFKYPWPSDDNEGAVL